MLIIYDRRYKENIMEFAILISVTNSLEGCTESRKLMCPSYVKYCYYYSYRLSFKNIKLCYT